MTVTVTMPYYKVGPLIVRAVEGIVRQTYADWRLVIVNDGDPDPPWPLIDHFRDDRIVRFDMDKNRGRYFADAVIFEACEPEWWALADPDDVSEPRRFEVALKVAAQTGVAVGPWTIHRMDGSKKTSYKALTEVPVRDRVRHMGGYGPGVLSGDRLRQVGGFHPGYRVAYDTLMLNLVRMCGPVGVTKKVLAHKFLRAGSLTTSVRTGMGSQYRRRVHNRRLRLWQKAWDAWHETGEVASVIRNDVPPRLQAEVSEQAARLRRLL